MNGPGDPRFRDPALVDFGGGFPGGGRRLERLGGALVDRPLPHGEGPRLRPGDWAEAVAVYRAAAVRGDEGRGRWEFTGPLPDPWLVRVPLPVGGDLALEVRPAPSGQLGVFLEQVAQWQWLAAHAPAGGTVLSLFAHSGASSLALAAAGSRVLHVDASRQALALARGNAAASGLADRPVRWLHDDAGTVVARLLRRGTPCAGAVLDPPSWGHGPDGQAFAIDRDLVPLVENVARLMAAGGSAPAGPLLVTCHSPGWHPDRLHDTLHRACRAAGLPAGDLESGPLVCTDDAGRALALGSFARRPPRP
jgi:23S rRNA (cytosine1962-C5)-methyltransferase